MKFYSTNHKSESVSFQDAVLLGLAPDGGLYMPESIKTLNADFLKGISHYSLVEIAEQMTKAIIEDSIPDQDLQTILTNVLNFEIPISHLHDNIFALELFWGPTMAFKDFGARFMAQIIAYFLKQSGQELNILVATSGDTGSAVAHGFLGQPGIKVTLLYPSGKVSLIQEKQLTTMGQNVTALEVNGSFDDCQRLVKQAFSDQDLRKQVNLSSANSINIARLIPQSFYYAYAAARLTHELPLVISVPSGNFGNITAGLIAKKLGIKIDSFIAATNANSVVPEYLTTGEFKPRASVQTISNAMDVGNPSNFARMLDLYKADLDSLKSDIQGISFSDSETIKVLKDVYLRCNYIMDPHGAVAYLGLQNSKLVQSGKATGVFLETAHPAKFIDVVESALDIDVPIPDKLQEYISREKSATKIDADYDTFKQIVLAA